MTLASCLEIWGELLLWSAVAIGSVAAVFFAVAAWLSSGPAKGNR